MWHFNRNTIKLDILSTQTPYDVAFIRVTTLIVGKIHEKNATSKGVDNTFKVQYNLYIK